MIATYLIRGRYQQRGNVLNGTVVKQDCLVLWSLNTNHQDINQKCLPQLLQ